MREEVLLEVPAVFEDKAQVDYLDVVVFCRVFGVYPQTQLYDFFKDARDPKLNDPLEVFSLDEHQGVIGIPCQSVIQGELDP